MAFKSRPDGFPRSSVTPGAIALALVVGAPLSAIAADGADAPPPELQIDAFHLQATLVDQGNLQFHSPYQGRNSLDPAAKGRETFDLTLYGGFRPWRGAEVWINPEIDQGFGLSDTLGVAGFPSGEAYKVGKADPYLRLQRFFLRQTFDLAGEREAVDADLNQLAGDRSKNRVVLTVGKFGAPDIFDANSLAHDPRGDFLNWTIIDAGTFDYAADAWGYTAGAAVEWYQGGRTFRFGAFDLSNVPNSEHLDPHFGQFQLVGEAEQRFQLQGRDGVVRITGFLSRGRMGAFDDAVRVAQGTGAPADIVAVRTYRSRDGVSLNLEQQVADGIGVFARAGVADGAVEPYEFSDVDRTVSGGVSISGKRWGRPDDVLGVGAVVNGISKAHQAYLAAGGLGILVGDGRLPHPGDEHILEAFYSLPLVAHVKFSLDGQVIDNPAYNRDRGPVAVFAARLHGQF